MSVFDGDPRRDAPVRLRPYQEQAVTEINARTRAGVRRLIVVAATGSGKTLIAAHIIARAAESGSRVLFMAHRRELITQAYERLIEMGVPEDQLGVLMAQDRRRRPGARVQVASVDTLRNRAKPLADVVFVDECLPAGTLVDGRPIETIHTGETVESYDHTRGCVTRQRVTHVFSSSPNALVTIHLEDGRHLSCTPAHPIFTTNGYTPAGLLQPGALVAKKADFEGFPSQSRKNATLAFAQVERIESHKPGTDGRFGGLCPNGRVYNLEIEHNHNYFAEGILTHNCHRATAKSYRDIAACYPNAIHLGLTATPFRANGDGLGDAYDDLLLVASPRQLIEEGHLVEPRVFTVPTESLPDLSSVRTKRGDYDQRELAQAVDSKALVGNLVEHWMRHAKGVRTVAFAVSIAHSKHIAEQFRSAGVAAEHLDGTTPIPERDAILARLESGETTVVSNCLAIFEGWDQPAVKCAILARPTRSTGLYLQQAGRILRPWNGQQAIILDHGGCVLEHGLPQDDRDFSLQGNKKKRGGKASAPVRTCPSCFAVLPLSTRVCPECDTVLIEQAEVPQEREGTLVEVRPGDLKQIELERLHSIAEKRGYKPGWVYYRFKEKFGHPPPRDWLSRARPTADGNALADLLRKAARSKSRLDWSSIDAAVRSSAGTE